MKLLNKIGKRAIIAIKDRAAASSSQKSNFLGNSVQALLPITQGQMSANTKMQKRDVGIKGKNLTISVLSHNRPELTIRLLRSLARQLDGFEGTVLLTDNASEKFTLEQLRLEAKKLKINVIFQELHRNYGVAGGRNRAAAGAKTDWIMFLDNDIYFERNILEQARKTILALNANFFNLPLWDSDKKRIFSFGGQLTFQKVSNKVHVGGGSAISQGVDESSAPTEPFISTFLLGGAAIVSKEHFLDLGGFDDNMFIGFEDLDFSLQLLNKGIAIATIPYLALVHDHASPKTPTSLDYERQRYARETLLASANYFEEKNQIAVWDEDVDEWLANRRKKMGL